MRRDIVQEIIARRGRGAGHKRMSAFTIRQASIHKALSRVTKNSKRRLTSTDKELLRYFPVAHVASIEAYYRQSVADLVDTGQPYLDRISKMAKAPALSISTASLLLEEKFSLGEYVAHFLSISSFEDISTTMSALLDMDFVEHLMTSEFNIPGEEKIRLDPHRGEIIKAVKALFQLRHIICHEFANDAELSVEEVVLMSATADLVIALSEVVLWAEESRRVA